MMIGRQRERITSGLTTMIREHNRASSSPSPSSSSSSSSSTPPAPASPSSASSGGSITLRRDRLLGVSNPSLVVANSGFSSSCSNSELQEEDVWGSGSVQESGILDEQDVQASSAAPSSSRSILSKWRTAHEAWKPSNGGISAPMNVPDWGKILKNTNLTSSATRSHSSGSSTSEDEEDEEEDGKENLVPPHKLVDSRSRSMVSFSVFEGAGRTLKGWDLRRMRNRVWEQTGFLGV